MSENGHVQDEQEYFFITNEEGVEERFEILYEFENEETGYSYMLLIPDEEGDSEDEDKEVEVYPIRYKLVDEEPVFEMIESDEEWQMVEEVLNALEAGEEEEED